MEWLRGVDYYCERLGPGFGAEPFNALTGLAFLVVGLVAFRRGPQGDDRRAGAGLALVGVASALHHGFAVDLTSWADILANQLYLALLGVLLLRRLAGAGAVAAGAGAGAAVVVVYAMGQSPALRGVLGLGADMFFLLMLILLAVALSLRSRHPVTSGGIALAAVVLALGLPFRFFDEALCGLWPLGTHGIWHLMNASATALLLAALAKHRQAR